MGESLGNLLFSVLAIPQCKVVGATGQDNVGRFRMRLMGESPGNTKSPKTWIS